MDESGAVGDSPANQRMLSAEKAAEGAAVLRRGQELGGLTCVSLASGGPGFCEDSSGSASFPPFWGYPLKPELGF